MWLRELPLIVREEIVSQLDNESIVSLLKACPETGDGIRNVPISLLQKLTLAGLPITTSVDEYEGCSEDAWSPQVLMFLPGQTRTSVYDSAYDLSDMAKQWISFGCPDEFEVGIVRRHLTFGWIRRMYNGEDQVVSIDLWNSHVPLCVKIRKYTWNRHIQSRVFVEKWMYHYTRLSCDQFVTGVAAKRMLHDALLQTMNGTRDPSPLQRYNYFLEDANIPDREVVVERLTAEMRSAGWGLYDRACKRKRKYTQ